MIQGPPEPVLLEVFVGLIKFVGAPAATALGIIWLLRKAIIPKANGAEKAQTERDKQEALQHLDLTLTEHFDQLRRDLTTTVERQHELSRDDMRNALATLILEQELGRLRAGDKR